MSDEKRLERIEDKIDGLTEKIAETNVILGKQHVTLEEHQRRSLANEKAVDTLKDELKPVILHVSMVKLVLKVAFALLLSEAVLHFIIGKL